MRYSANTGCFYPEDIDYTTLPDDLITVPQEDFDLAISRPPNTRIKIVAGRVQIEEIPVDPAEVKAGMWEAIKAERDRRIGGGGFKVEVSPGVFKWFHSDGHSRIQHLGLKDEIRDTTGNDSDAVIIDDEPVAWKTMAGDFVPLTRKLVNDIVKAAKITDKRLFKAAEIHKAMMEASADPANYNYLAGWPEVFGG